ncbi:hypothetical protein PAHAL_2G040700 [Panicum hallii]|uniref:Uncharacterized protein n=1 Tax=Panicum hallii TaxID=206008 RepID=A0A2T8KMW9_9POAL|nr:hypothetical protein PAHAL_2G040700 [Panicum hallii]
MSCAQELFNRQGPHLPLPFPFARPSFHFFTSLVSGGAIDARPQPRSGAPASSAPPTPAPPQAARSPVTTRASRAHAGLPARSDEALPAVVARAEREEQLAKARADLLPKEEELARTRAHLLETREQLTGARARPPGAAAPGAGGGGGGC